MARQNPIQTTYDPSIYNEGIILQKDGSILTKPINEDGTPNTSGQQTVTEPGKGTITIRQTVNGSTSSYSFNVDQKNNQTITLPTITSGGGGSNSQAVEHIEPPIGQDVNIELTNTPKGTPLFLLKLVSGDEVGYPVSISGSGKNWVIRVPNPNASWMIIASYIY